MENFVKTSSIPSNCSTFIATSLCMLRAPTAQSHTLCGIALLSNFNQQGSRGEARAVRTAQSIGENFRQEILDARAPLSKTSSMQPKCRKHKMFLLFFSSSM